MDYFKSISEKLRGIIFSFMQGNTSLLKGVCKEKSFQNNLFLDMISYRINILNEKRDQNSSFWKKAKIKNNKNRQIGSLTGCEKTFSLFFQSFGIANCSMW